MHSGTNVRVIPKTQKMVFDAALLNTQHYKVRIKGKVEKSWEWSSALFYTSVLYLFKKEPSGHSQLRSTTLLMYLLQFIYLSIYLSCIIRLDQMKDIFRLSNLFTQMCIDYYCLNTQFIYASD